MKFPALASSLLALALFAGPSLAGSTREPGSFIVAQADDDQADDASGDRIAKIQKFLGNKRPAAKFDDEALAKRLKRAKAFLKVDGLSPEMTQALNAEVAELEAETAKRQGGSAAKTGEQPAASDAGTQQKTAEATSAAPSGDAAAFLADQRPLSDYNDKDLRARMKKAVELMKADGTSKADKRKLRDIVKEARAEMDKRKGGTAASGDESGGTQKKKEEEKTEASAGNDAPATGGAAAILDDTKPLSGLSDKELRNRMRSAVKLMKADSTSAADKKKLRQVVRDARAEMDKRKGGGSTAKTGTDTDTAAKTDDSAASTGDANAKAKALLGAGVDASKLSDADLRKRLQATRDLLADKSLSKDNRQALRKQLAAEKQVLRSRVKQENATKQEGGDTNVSGDNNTVVNTTVINNTTINYYIKDKRPPKDLKDDELRLRIRVLRDAELDVKYSEAERRFWRQQLRDDRAYLNIRLGEQRRRREADLKIRVKNDDFRFNLSLDFEPDRRPPPYVFAAEADVDELEDILSAPPRREIKRRYTVEEIESDPDARDAVARIEIDTVRFGFGESFLREEEVDNLEAIAEIMEEILAVSPGERFMIEGHTDLVGTEAANLQLSRERAKAVKEALTTYYVIPARNLDTVGYGERFPKIPVDEPEEENRRVSIARITPLVGALSD